MRREEAEAAGTAAEAEAPREAALLCGIASTSSKLTRREPSLSVHIYAYIYIYTDIQTKNSKNIYTGEKRGKENKALDRKRVP